MVSTLKAEPDSDLPSAVKLFKLDLPQWTVKISRVSRKMVEYSFKSGLANTVFRNAKLISGKERM